MLILYCNWYHYKVVIIKLRSVSISIRWNCVRKCIWRLNCFANNLVIVASIVMYVLYALHHHPHMVPALISPLSKDQSQRKHVNRSEVNAFISSNVFILYISANLIYIDLWISLRTEPWSGNEIGYLIEKSLEESPANCLVILLCCEVFPSHWLNHWQVITISYSQE